MSEESMTDYDILLMDVRRSIRYHDRRQGFYQAFLNFYNFVVLVFGMATVATFGAAIGESLPAWVRLLPSMLASVAVAFSMAFRISDKAWLHQDLKRDFIKLEQRLELAPQRTPDVVSQIQADRLGIEAREPKVLRVLDTLCHNEILRSMGYDRSELVEVGIVQRFLAPFRDFREHTLHSQT